MSYHVVADGRILPVAFARIQDAYVYALVRGDGPEGVVVKSWALIERHGDGTDLVHPTGELLPHARRWREETHSIASPEPVRRAG